MNNRELYIDKEITLQWSPSIKEYYTNKGYAYTKFGDYFTVKIEDFNPNSAIKVSVKCQDCGKEFKREFRETINKPLKCRSCLHKKKLVCDCCGSEEKPRRKYENKMLCPKCYYIAKRKGGILITQENEIITKNEYSEIVLRNAYGIEIGRAKIDTDDIEKVKKYKWRLSNGYVKSTVNDIGLSRVIMDCNDRKFDVDHLNRNTLNNTKNNLCIVPHKDNCKNRGGGNNELFLGGVERNSLADGIGIRYVVFGSFCLHRCQGCHNKNLWNRDSGIKTSVSAIYDNIMKQSGNPNVTFSGGDPFFQAKAFITLASKIKTNTNKTIWCYTGFTYESLLESPAKEFHELLSYIDVLVDGKFIEKLKDSTLAFRGSSNQRIIDMNETRKNNGAIVLWKNAS